MGRIPTKHIHFEICYTKPEVTTNSSTLYFLSCLFELKKGPFIIFYWCMFYWLLCITHVSPPNRDAATSFCYFNSNKLTWERNGNGLQPINITEQFVKSYSHSH